MSYRVLIADDEPFIVRGLKNLIDWTALGLEIVGSAHDGETVAAQLVELKPDILVSDIRMPKKTGLELLKLVTMSALPTKVIFISGHREFAYAREAISYGAVDYLLKPIHTEELGRALAKAISLIEREQGRETAVTAGDPAPPSSPSVTPLAAGPGLGAHPRYAALAMVETAGGGSRLMRIATINLLKKLLSRDAEVHLTEWDEIIVARLGCGEPPEPEALKARLQGAVLAELGITLRIACGPVVSESADLETSVEGALAELAGQLGEGTRTPAAGIDAFRRVCDYIAANYASPISLESSAEVACMNLYYFSAFFKRHAGRNFKDYLNQVRVDAARTLLLRTDKKTYEIAGEVGFGDPRNFREVFKRYYGQNPAEYRAAIRKGLP